MNRFSAFALLTALTCYPAFSQLAAPNAAGVSVGHLHLFVTDVETHKRFWTKSMGGVLVKNQNLELIQFPGVYIIVRQGNPAGLPAGSVVNHFGFVVKDMQGSIAKWRADGLTYEPGPENPNQGFIHAPDGMRIEVFGDPSIDAPIKMDHIHFNISDIPAMQAWYAKTFGGPKGERKCVACVSKPRMIPTVDLPGSNLSYSVGDPSLLPTKGRTLDHIGFEVTNLNEFVKKLEAQGIKLDEPMRTSPNSSKVHVAFITDPWGTRIELTEGLAP